MHPIFSSSLSFRAVLLFWMLITLLVVFLIAELMQARFHEQALIESMALVVPWYFSYLFLCFSNIHLCLRLPIEKTSVHILIGSQVAATVVTVGFWMLLGYWWSRELSHFGMREVSNIYLHSLETNSLLGAILYAIWILVHYVYLMASGNENERSDILRQKLLISEIELRAVKETVHPHFMYNSLNMLANLSLVAPNKIHDLCVQISDFLRYSINYSKKEKITVKDEVRHIQNYLSIEKERFGTRLDIRFEISPESEKISTIPLLLFPLIENSIKHGLDSSVEPGFIEIKIVVNNKNLWITITNSYDPEGLKRSGTGLGLSALEKRLWAHYGDKAVLRTDRKDRRFTVSLVLPV
ncbi:sensor histidine kinase [Teredinibacter haidensis]|uniref:sensor histidine kinase n=1 Tax=Teredinibacter haidensis TaxID=2731755 RepID=UPI000948F04E|nr:histidine kinase [Teredinibacter haidensis]